MTIQWKSFQWEPSYIARHEEAKSSFRQLGFYKPKTGQDIRALEVAVVFVVLLSECLRYKLLYIPTSLDLYRSLSIVGLVKSRRLR
jgi:hypothetical protein